MLEGLKRGTLLLCALVLAVLATACERGPGQVLSRWTLEVPGAAPHPIDIPARLGGELPRRVLQYRLRTTVALEPRLVGRDVELVLPYLPAFASLRVDGHEARFLGDETPAAEYGGSAPHRWLLPPASTAGGAPLTLELTVTHRWTPSARLDVAPELVPAGASSPNAARNRLLNEQGAWFGMIALSQVGVTFLAVFFWDRRRRAYLWFAIQALTASYYPAYILGLPALAIGWNAQHILLAQSLAVAPIVSVYFTHDFFGLPRPSRAWLVLLGAALLSPIMVWAFDSRFLVLSYAAPVVVVCVLSGIVYQLFTGLRLLRTYPDRGIVVFFLCCWLALGGSSWVDLLAWAGGPEVLAGGRPACFGLGLFGIFQSMLLSRSHFRSLAESDRLNERLRGQVRDLQERQAEIQGLNDELRRQVGRRSADILAALTSADRVSDAGLGVGDVVEGRYRIVGTLGVGGMGMVFEAERLSDGKHLALKVTREVRGLALARLAREAQIATHLQHPNLVSVVDADVAQSGYAFLVMELVQGRSLAECRGPHAASWSCEVLVQVLEGMKALHAQGIIHRDLKPSNILLSEEETPRPRVKITDFGISRWLEDEALDGALERDQVRMDAPTVKTRAVVSGSTPARAAPTPRDPRSSPQLTQTGNISGTPSYVAPELAAGSGFLSPAVDVFSFGVVAYGLFAGKLPFVEPPLLVRIAGRELVAPPTLGVSCGLSGEAARALDACLSPEPGGRPTVDELLAILHRELAGSSLGETAAVC